MCMNQSVGRSVRSILPMNRPPSSHLLSRRHGVRFSTCFTCSSQLPIGPCTCPNPFHPSVTDGSSARRSLLSRRWGYTTLRSESIAGRPLRYAPVVLPCAKALRAELGQGARGVHLVGLREQGEQVLRMIEGVGEPAGPAGTGRSGWPAVHRRSTRRPSLHADTMWRCGPMRRSSVPLRVDPLLPIHQRRGGKLVEDHEDDRGRALDRRRCLRLRLRPFVAHQ